MKIAAHIAAALLGLLFLAASVTVLFKLGPTPPAPPEGSPAAMFFGAFAPTGYLTFVKVFELIGGVLVAIPRTRNLGLLVLGPIIVNILAFHGFVMAGEGLFSPMLLVICALALFLLWTERKAFAFLVTR
jgi:putative oxidoreductase